MERTTDELSLPALIRFLSAMGEARMLVVGDVMLDEYMDGEVVRVSPEAPVPVIPIGSRHHVAGGAAHVALVMASLGAPVDLVAVVGDDEAGQHLLDGCRTAGIDCRGVITDATRPTTTKTRIVAGAQQIARLDVEDASPHHQQLRAALVEAVSRSAPVGAIVVSDYAKGVLSDDVLAAVRSLAGRIQAVVVVDPKDADLSRYRGADVVKLNRQELAMAVGGAVSDDGLDAHAEEVRRRTGAGAVVVTLGGDGLAIAGGSLPCRILPAGSQEVFDVTGAGDVVAAVLALGLAAGLPIDLAASCANLAAGVSVRRRGATTITPAQLLRELQPRSRLEPTAHVPTERRDLVDLVDLWRRSGEQIVFTNGCFDLFHRGHLELLRTAASFGDRLVVAIDADASVRRLKGPGRPIIDQRSRAEIIGALSFVDAVVVFDDDLGALIADLGPHVLVKGADYRDREVVGRAQVESNGGRVEFVPLMDGHSTTTILSRLQPGGDGASTAS